MDSKTTIALSTIDAVRLPSPIKLLILNVKPETLAKVIPSPKFLTAPESAYPVGPLKYVEIPSSSLMTFSPPVGVVEIKSKTKLLPKVPPGNL